ncbi:Phosphatidylinositol 3-kinase regulatory subunit alpha [Dirofilaria immitis]|nr:Phosphatidylinositol 3-kinase regulatory subunit alpha [Dirofilaria immitis]
MEEKEEDCAHGLQQQEWYWANASKEEIASAICDCPSGTFCVRDASTKGNYTLTLRYGERNRLIRIIVAGEHCGFTEDMLKFESVVSLIDYYRRNSLLEYNRQLSTELLYPLRKPNFKQTSWIIDGVRSVEHLLCQLRGLHAAHLRFIRRDDQITAELDSLKEELQRKRQAHAAFTAAYTLFLKQVELLESNKQILFDEFEIAQSNKNKEAQQRRLQSICYQQQQMVEQNERLTVVVLRVFKLLAELDTCQFRLCQLNVSQVVMDKVLQEVSFLADLEQEPLARVLLQLTLRWQPDRYLSLDCTKDSAFKVIRSLMDCNPDNSNGIFLIRPSQSQAVVCCRRKPECVAEIARRTKESLNCLIPDPPPTKEEGSEYQTIIKDILLRGRLDLRTGVLEIIMVKVQLPKFEEQFDINNRRFRIISLFNNKRPVFCGRFLEYVFETAELCRFTPFGALELIRKNLCYRS